MGLISIKLGIMADLFGIIGLVGLAVLLAAVVWLVISVANFDSVLFPVLCAVLAAALIAGGLALTPMEDEAGDPENTAVPKEDSALPSAEDPANVEADPGQLGTDPADGEAIPAAVEPADMPEGEDGSAASGGQQASNGTAAPKASDTEYIYETTLDGWRIRMTLPPEWRDICVIENDGWGLNFYQKASYNTIYGGWLFELWAREGPFDPTPNPDSEVIYEEGVNYVAKDGFAFGIVVPTDVRFADGVMEEYDQMQKTAPDILKSIEIIRE